ncbi:MAG: hypothetical protein KME27_05635 [Lyngbya sp. HA4199-MV5]|nr:hypothetical protein [Lyngbya sp. HA4199-MV5]
MARSRDPICRKLPAQRNAEGLRLKVCDRGQQLLGAVINYDYTSVAAGVPASSLVCWGGRDDADTARFRS